jgi:proteasome lid subunit RPN8/RPN11
VTPAVTPIAIPRDLLAAIYAHAIAAFPDECCGYLVGADPGAVDAAVACRNAQADGAHPIAPERGADTGFVIAGAELLGFARSFDTARPARIVYHSHTSGRAYLSAVDREMAATPAGPAYPVQHVVIGVVGRAITLREFPRAKESRGPSPAIDLSPSVTEVAQFAWSDAARDYVEVARWPGDGAAP